MWVGTVRSSELFKSNRWTVSYFSQGETLVSANFRMRPLREVVKERRGTTEPQQLGSQLVNYIGLENIRSQTGELVNFAPRKASSIRSRSKVFRRGDILFGRLRPELNKVFLAEGCVTEGICSTEFIVLVPVERVLVPRFLRHILASQFVTQFAEKFRSGAALPRIDVDGLLSIPVPVPPFSVQEKIAQHLAVYDDEVERLRERLFQLPQKMTNALVAAMKSGNEELVEPI